VRQPISYSSQWKQVDSLSNQGLPKSALIIVNKIYEQAKKEKNDPQYIKAVIYKLKLKADFREETIPASIKEVDAEIKGLQKNLHGKSCILSRLSSINPITRITVTCSTTGLSAENNPSDSIQTWDLKTLSRKTLKTYLLSLQDPELLKTIPIGDFGDILVKQETRKSTCQTESQTKSSYRPTLYDFLCWRVLDYLALNRKPGPGLWFNRFQLIRLLISDKPGTLPP
jgi:hypothetical protein